MNTHSRLNRLATLVSAIALLPLAIGVSKAFGQDRHGGGRDSSTSSSSRSSSTSSRGSSSSGRSSGNSSSRNTSSSSSSTPRSQNVSNSSRGQTRRSVDADR